MDKLNRHYDCSAFALVVSLTFRRSTDDPVSERKLCTVALNRISSF